MREGYTSRLCHRRLSEEHCRFGVTEHEVEPGVGVDGISSTYAPPALSVASGADHGDRRALVTEADSSARAHAEGAQAMQRASFAPASSSA